MAHYRWSPVLRHLAALGATVLLVIAASGCAGPRGYRDPIQDPLEKINRPIHSFNMGFDRFLFRPIAKGYEVVTPDPVQTGINNFFVNLRSPLELINNLLQGKFKGAGVTTGRAIINTTLGLGGLFDPATHAGLKRHEEDFGQTLAVWRMPHGPYIVIPFLGPSTPRDAIGLFGDAYASLLIDRGLAIDDSSVRDKLLILRLIDIRSQFLERDKALREAFDSYAFLRDVYLQRRQYLIFDGNPPEPELEEFDEEFEAEFD